MQPSPNAFWIALSMGILCGLVPLVLGVRRDRMGWGTVGFFVCAVCGVAFGFLLAAPVAALFSWRILQRPKQQPPPSAPPPSA